MPHCSAILVRAFFFLAPLIFSTAVFARAGGGEGFSSPSDGGGGGGGGGGGDGEAIFWIIYLLIRLCIQYPVIGIPLTIAVIVFVIYSAKISQSQMQDRTLNRGTRAHGANTHARSVSLLTQADPNFNADLLTQRIHQAFLKVQHGWAAQDVSAIRPFVSDGVLERFSLQFQEQKEQGYRNQIDDISIRNVQISDVRIGPVFHAVTFAIAASAIDTRVDLATGKKISGDTFPESFVEFWTFLRRPAPQNAQGASTDPAKPGLIEGKCPNCGAPIVDSDATNPAAAYKCAACGSALLFGSHDWVLAEITQANAHTSDIGAAEPPSSRRYQAEQDPGFSSAHLEDRASVLFWRWVKSLRTGSSKPLQKVADPDFCQTVEEVIEKHTNRKEGTRTFPGNCAIGSVRVLGVLPGEETDRALVVVEWSGAMQSGPIRPSQNSSAQGEGSGGGASARPRPVQRGGLYCTSLFTLTRKTGVTTNPDLGLSSAHCPTCGAPESDSASDSCPYCGSILNNGSSGWVFSHMEDTSAPASRALIAELQTQRFSPPPASALTPDSSFDSNPAQVPTPHSIAHWFASAIHEDGIITDRERELFTAFCVRHHIDADHASAILDTATRQVGSDAAPHKNLSPEEARRWLFALADAIYSEGKPDPQDLALLRTAARGLHLTAADADQAAKNARIQAIARAREAIRQSKRHGH